MRASISFDRVAGFCDTTRVTDERETAQSIDPLEDVPSDGTALEIGVGTGPSRRSGRGAVERYGPDLTQRFEPEAPHLWWVYDLGD